MQSRRQDKNNGLEIGSDINTLKNGGMPIVTINREGEGWGEGGEGRVLEGVVVVVG